MRQDRLRDTGKASRYPLESPTLTHAAAGEKNKDHKEVGDTPGIDPPSNRGNLKWQGSSGQKRPWVHLGVR